LKRIAVLLVLVAACSASPQQATPSVSPSPTSAAADLRVHLDLLLTEHVFLIAKAGDAAAAGRTDEYKAYATDLTNSAADLASLLREALGDTASSRFGAIWSQYLDSVAAYTVGAAAHDDAKKSAAADSLNNTLAPELGQWLSDVSGLAEIPTAKQLVASVQSILDDEAGLNWTSLYLDTVAGAGTARHLADEVGPQIIKSYPDRFPGSAQGKSFDRRLLLSAGLQQLAYIGTMASEATINGGTDEAAAAGKVVTNTANALGPGTWKSWTDDLPAYAAAGSGGTHTVADQIAADNRGLAQSFPRNSAVVQAYADGQTGLEVRVIDAQRNKDVSSIGSRDRASASAMERLAAAIGYASD
jgi:hypothetical protein